MERNYRMVATTMAGLEEVLAEELKQLGAQDVQSGVRNVAFKGDKGFMYKSNLALRTAIRILKPIRSFRVYDEDDLYKKLQQIRWEEYLSHSNTFAINAAVLALYPNRASCFILSTAKIFPDSSFKAKVCK